MPNKPMPGVPASPADAGIVCVGLGPGDPDLMSVKAHRIVAQARHVAYFRKRGRPGKARQAVDGLLPADAHEYPMEYPVTTELALDDPAYAAQLAAFYDGWCQRLAALAQTRQVVVLCEGDPFFYGSFMHLYARFRTRAEYAGVPVAVVPGIPGMVGCWHASGWPITWGDDALCVLAGTLPDDELARRVRQAEALAIMKVGRNLPRIRRALAQAGRLHAAWLVQNATTPDERVQPLAQVADGACPYFAIVLVHGAGRSPGMAQAAQIPPTQSPPPSPPPAC